MKRAESLDLDTMLGMLPPSRDLVEYYQKKLKKQKLQYDALQATLNKIENDMNSKYQLEERLQQALNDVQEAQRQVNDIRALYESERSQSMVLAVTVDKLRGRHERDKEMITLLKKLSGEGKIKQDHLFPFENAHDMKLEANMNKLEKLLKEQALSFLNHRQILKNEHEIERNNLEAEVRRLTERVRGLEKQDLNSQKKIVKLLKDQQQLASQWELQRQLQWLTGANSASSASEHESLPAWILNSNETAVRVQQLTETLKNLQNSLDEKKKEADTWKRIKEDRDAEVLRLRSALQEVTSKQNDKDEAFRNRLTHLANQLEKLEQRRLNEAGGFRNEIRLLREELSRSQRGLYYLSMKDTKA